MEGEIFNNNKLTINANGLINGERKAKDGIAFFGTKLTKVILLKNSKNGIIVNDFVLSIDNDNLNMLHTFIIYYKKETNKFYLRSYKEKESNSLPLILIKLEKSIIIKKKQIIKIGDSYFILFPQNDKIEVSRLEKNEKKQ